MAKSIGIDLGTTNSAAAVKKIQTEIIKNKEGDSITPSCVAIGRKGIMSWADFIVGKDALEWRKQNPQNTITAVKRLMGRNIDDDEIRKRINSNFQNYKICEYAQGSKNSIAVVLNGKEYTPQEISAEILKKIKSDSEKALGEKIEYAVITVPAYFNDKQKHATRTAATLAGLKVHRLLPEPTAAAISFGVDEVGENAASNVIIFDFGGGTFDLSLLTISGGQFIEQGKAGDMWLGGDDIDQLLADYVLKSFEEENDIDDVNALIDSQDLKRKNRFHGELKTSVENAKITLAEDDEAYVEISGILKSSDGSVLDLDVEISREQFYKLIEPVLKKTVELTRQLIESTDFTPDLIDRVLLVGGSSRIPAVTEALKKEFGIDKVLVHDRPMLAVAEGAAILSHRLADSYECPGCGKTVKQDAAECTECGYNLEEHISGHGVFDIVHTSAHDYYIHLANGEKHLLIEKNTPLPCEAFEEFSLVSFMQKLIHLQFSNSVNDTTEEIGELWLGLNFDMEDVLTEDKLDEMIENKELNLHIKVKMSIDENNLIEVNAEMVEFPDIVISKTLSRGGKDEKIFYEIEEVIEDVNSGTHSEFVVKGIPERLANVAEDVNKILDKDSAIADEKMILKAETKLGKVKKMLENKIDSVEGNIRYVKHLLRVYGDDMPADLRKDSALKITEMQQAYENADYHKEIKVIDSFRRFIDDRLEDLNPLITLRDSFLVLKRFDSSQYETQRNLHDKLLQAYKQGDMNKYRKLLDSNDDVIYEAEELRYRISSGKDTTIHKGIYAK